MLDIRTIRENPDRVRKAMIDKSHTDTEKVDLILSLDVDRRKYQTEQQEAQARSNQVSKEIGLLLRQGDQEEAQQRIEESGRLKQIIKEFGEKADAVAQEQAGLMLDIPNIPHPSVPIGRTAAENRIEYTYGEQTSFDFEPLSHWDLATKHRLIDFEAGTRVTGTGYPFYLGKGARLQRALINFFLDLAGEADYEEVQSPLLVNEDSARGTGQLPDKEDLMYEVQRDGFYLIPTAEVPLTNLFRDSILDESALPVRICGYTPCFRREAGSYGKDVRGLNRLHQFDKVELVHIVHPDTSYEALEALRSDAERPLVRLGIPYRRLLMCTGDMGFTQTKKYDLEVWSAGQQRWLEVSSISNFEAFQARRMSIRYRPQGAKKPVLVHTLNGSGLALPRVVAALLENNQRADGSIDIPDVLRPYTGFDEIT